MTSQSNSIATGVSRRKVLRNTAGGIAAVGFLAKSVAADSCVSINDAEGEELQTLRHVNEDRAEEIVEARPFRNVNHLLGLSFWQDPRQPAEMVDGDPGVCEYDVADVEVADGPPFPNIDGVAYSQGRVGDRHVEDTGVAHEVGDRVTFAGFERGGTTVADFREFSSDELNRNLNWNLWRQQPHQTIMFPLR